jgi:hypothetical protein
MKSMQSVFTLAKRNLAVLLMGMVALAGVAHAEGHAHKGKRGNLKITTPTQVGGTMLQPGDYTAREIDSPDGAVVEFVRVSYDAAAPEGTWPYDEEVVARVPSTEQALSERPKHTRLQAASEADVIALQIRGDEVEYLLEQSPADGRAGAMASRPTTTSRSEAYTIDTPSY